MDDDTTDLVRQLCTRAGMIMEDASAVAILVGGKTPIELRSIIAELQTLAEQVNAVLAAAKAMAA